MSKRCSMLAFALLVFGGAQAQDASDRAPAAGPAPAASSQASAGSAAAASSQARATDEAAQPPAEPGVKALSGMSILGNEEAPKSLVIVPWKSSQIGDEVGVENAVDERARPVDKEVFMREVHYFELRSSRAASPQ